MNVDVTVVGAGIIGLGCARALAASGRRVLVVDRVLEEPATLTAAGFLAPIFHTREANSELIAISFESLELWEKFARDLEAETDGFLDYKRHGTIHVALNPWHHQLLKQLVERHDEYGIETSILDAKQARRHERGLSEEIHSALHVGYERQVNPRLVWKSLRRSARRHSVQFVSGNVIKIAPGVVDLEGDVSIRSRATVVAGGAYWSGIKGIEETESVQKVRGKTIVVHADAPVCTHAIRTPDVYIAQRSSGIAVVGATREDEAFDLTQTLGSILDLLGGACETIPALRDAKFVETRSAFRAFAPSGLPIVRPDAEREGLFYATGHGRRGILLTPWTIEKIVSDVGAYLSG